MGSRVWLGAGLVTLGLVLPATASATTWQVTNTGDSAFTCPSVSSCTLRGAIAQADVAGGGDVVQVPAGHYTVSVNPINVTAGMQIVGTAGPAATTVEQLSTTVGIFAISSGAVTVSGLTLTGHEPNGGAIASQASALTLSDDVFTGNGPGAAGTQGRGGAVGVTGTAPTTLTVTNSTFSSNRAGTDGGSGSESGFGTGGAISFATPGALSITDSTFTGNKAGGAGSSGSGSGSGAGGAIYVDWEGATGSVDVSIARSVFGANSAGGSGSNGPESGNGAGGALAMTAGPGGGSLSVTDSTFSGNTAGGSGGSNFAAGTGEGGAIGAFAADPGDQLTANVTRSTFTGNHAGGDGGSDLETAEGLGGAIDYGSSGPSAMAVVDSTFDGNRAGGVAGTGVDSGQGNGGSIGTVSSAVLALTNDTLAGGHAGGADGRGGNLSTASSGSTTLKNTILSHGIADTGANCARPITSFGHNVETANDCGLTAAGDLPSTEPALGALADNGGLTQTMAPSAGSPAIDGGDNAGCPDTDQRGVLRPAGAACDIGAFEVATPGGTTGAVTGVHATSATLVGLAFNPDFGPGSASFQYGTSTAYGKTVGSAAVGPLTRSAPFSAKVTGLKPKTTYHFRLAASNGVGSGVGGDQTFTTSAGATISNIRLKPSNIVSQSGRGASITKAKKQKGGATLSFHATEAGRTTFTVQKPRRGFRSGKRCVARKPHGKKKARRCTLYKSLGSFSAKTSAGANRLHFTGRVKRRPLHLGAYRLRAVEKDTDGHNGPAGTRPFHIVP